MPITDSDIVLFQAQDNTDNDNGGGARTSNVVSDGQVNNLFPDISRIDATAGDVALRKVFPVVNTDNREVYYGAHAIIRKTPDDPQVSSLLFYTGDANDVRREAQNRIEAYVSPSFKASFYLFGNNIQGSKALTFLQRLEETLPNVGEVYALLEGQKQQYVRIQDIDVQEITLTYNNIDYVRRRIIATIEQPLGDDFTGSTFNPAGQQVNTADTFATQVSDAANFYGTTSLSVDANQGQSSITVTDVTKPLVPSTKQQTPIINVSALQDGLIIVPNTQGSVYTEDFNLTSVNPNYQSEFPVTPNSFVAGGFTDDGNGNLTDSGGATIGSIDYATGLFTWLNGPGFIIQGQYLPGSVIKSQAQYSQGIDVTTENQGSVYILNVAPVPDGLNTYVDYRSGGRWYRIQGNADKTLGVNPAIGAGLISDNGDGTATISTSLGANPDIDSTVIFSWGSNDAANEITTQAAAQTDTAIVVNLPHKNIDLTSALITYRAVDSISSFPVDFSTAVDGTVDLSLSEGMTFSLDPLDGKVFIRHGTESRSMSFPDFVNNLGDEDESLTISYNYADEPLVGEDGERKFVTDPTFTPNADFTQYTYDLGSPVEISNVKIITIATFWDYENYEEVTSDFILVSDDSGILRKESGGQPFGNVQTNGIITINIPTAQRNTGQTQLVGGTEYPVYTAQTIPIYAFRRGFQTLEYTTEKIGLFPNVFNGDVIYAGNSTLVIQAPPSIIGEITFNYGTPSQQQFLIEFSLSTNNGNVFNRSNEQVGTINYVSGRIEIDPTLVPFVVANQGFMRTVYGTIFVNTNDDTLLVKRAVFRTASEDLVTSSFILRYTTENGTFTATTDANGLFTGTDIDITTSYIDTTTGAAFVNFTAGINPTELKYDAVAQTTLPLDPELLGLDPVRLPANGRVPIFKDGNVVVVFNEQETDIAGTPTAGQVIILARQNQSYMEVIDVNGQRLDYIQYTPDRAAGTLTFANPLSLIDRNGDALTGPYKVIDRVEDMALVSNVQVTGQLQLTASLSRDYLAGTSYVASALVWGDIGARVYNLFSQQLFDVWSDELTQNPTIAQYDNINFPIQINNKDSFTGRWALIFQTSTTVDVVEESLGTILEDVLISADIAPNNPATGLPYFTIPSGGFGGGWVTGNVIRFNTDSGQESMWIIRTVQSGALTEDIDSIDIEVRGDAN